MSATKAPIEPFSLVNEAFDHLWGAIVRLAPEAAEAGHANPFVERTAATRINNKILI